MQNLSLAPVITALTPIIDRLVDKFVNLLDIVNQVFSRLSGKDTYTKAVKKQTEYADSADKATAANKRLKKSFLGMDEINALTDNSSFDSGKANTNDEYDYIDMPIEVEKIDGIISKMKILLGVVGGIGAAFAAWKIASGVGAFVNGIGSMFGKGAGAAGAAGGASISVVGTLKSMANVGIIVGGLITLIATLGLLMKIPGVKDVLQSGLELIEMAFKGMLELAIIYLAFSAGAGILQKAGGIKSALKGMASFGIIIGGLLVFIADLGILMKFPGLSSIIEQGVSTICAVFNKLQSIALPLILFSAGAVLLGKVPVSDVAKGLANLAIVLAGVTALVAAIGALMSIPMLSDFLTTGVLTVQQLSDGLQQAALPIIALSAYMALLGVVPVQTVALGLANMAIILAGTTVVLTAIGALMSIPGFSEYLGVGITSVQSAVQGIYDIAIPLSALSVLIAALGFASPAVIVEGMVGFAVIIGGLSLVLVALGALNQIEGFSWIVGEGGKVLMQLGEILGGFAGSIVAGFVDKMTDALPGIGTKLSLFMTNARPFFEGVGLIDSRTAIAAQALAGVILALTAAGLLEGLTSWLTGGNSIEKFGAMLPGFGKDMMAYAAAVDGLDGDVVENSANAAKSLAEFADAIPNSGGVAGFFAGENDLDKFAAMLPDFGKNLKKYSDNVRGLDPDIVDRSGKAAKSLAEFADTIPNHGGVAGFFAGENDLDTFAAMLPNFGKNLKKYSDNVKGIDSRLITDSATSAQSLTALADNIPNAGGVIAKFTGDNRLDTFSEMLPAFGKNLKSYANSVKGLDPKIVTESADAGKALTNLAHNIPNEGGFVSLFTGDNGIDAFGKKLASFGQSFKTYYDYIKGVNVSVVKTVTDSIADLVELAKKLKDNGIDDEIEDFAESLAAGSGDFQKFFQTEFSAAKAQSIGKSFGRTIGQSIVAGLKEIAIPTIKATVTKTTGGGRIAYEYQSTYASGGFPDEGQMFIAREAGAELVGTIGRRTAVVNNEQIVESVAQGVADANAEQNVLLREQNAILRKLLEKDPAVGSYDPRGDFVSSAERRNRRDGKTVIPVGV